jgi:response regulator RpfG family c-di-GMP phosphodiesterase
MSHKILIVDDEAANLRLLDRLFRRDFNVLTASSGEEALLILEQHDVTLLITDQRMPGMSGIELLQRATSLRPHLVRIILTGYTDVGALVEAINCGQVYKYVTKPWNNDELRLTVERAIEHYETNKARHDLALTNQRLVMRMKKMTRGFLLAITDALEAKDEYTRGHAQRVSAYATAIGRRMGLDASTLELLSFAAFLHDIGEIGIPDAVSLKPEALTPDEHAVMQLHSQCGARLLREITDVEDIADAVLHHHEHFDGTGYPDGLSGEQIPILSRIILVADAYDAITNPRAFREAWTHEAALELLDRGSRVQFDPEVVQAFSEINLTARVPSIMCEGLSSAVLPVTPSTLDVDYFSGRHLLTLDPAHARCHN